MSVTDLSALLNTARERFAAHFGRPATHAAAAPGRVNLIGEHVDYCDGFVLPIAIERQTVVVGARNGAKHARVVTLGDEGQGTDEDAVLFEVSSHLRPDEPEWSNYIRGVVAGFFDRGHPLEGFDLLIHSNVPLGSGLSSSAALEVATATLLAQMFQVKLGPVDKALLCQWAEHHFPKMPCGIMDQYASACAQEGCALLLDCRSLEARQVPLADEQLAVLIINTNVRHELAGSEYPQRRRQCEEAAKAMGVSALRDATAAQLEDAKALVDPVTWRRARHVVSEIARTQQAADALQRSDWNAFGQLMGASHRSLRDDFEVSCLELDTLVDLLTPQRGVYGARMTGGGFGGCTVSLVQAAAVEQVLEAVLPAYQEKTGIEATAFVTRPGAGARVC